MKLTKKDIYISPRYSLRRAFVVGCQFGPFLLVVGGSAEEAIEVFHEKFAEPPEDLSEFASVEEALASGEVMITDGGFRAVDPYLWLKEFTGDDAIRIAGLYYRASGS
jgi:hypothetical protein